MTADDLFDLYNFSGIPPEHRLRTFIEAKLSGDAYEVRLMGLADACGYSRVESVRLWTNLRSRVPLSQLPAVAEFLGVHLSVLLALWIAETAPEEHADELFKAASPVVTARELEIVELARLVYAEQEDDAADADLLPLSEAKS